MEESNVDTLGGDNPLYDTKERLFFRVASAEKKIEKANEKLDEVLNELRRRDQNAEIIKVIGRLWAWFKGWMAHGAETASKIRIE